MADKSKIAWCDATINPCYGCSPVSPACDHCYAARLADRMAHNVAVCQYYEGLTDRDGQWTGRVNFFPERMTQALSWENPRSIFVGSMTDIFQEAVPDQFLDDVFSTMALASWHTFILLTKRPSRMLEYVNGISSEPVDSPRDCSVFDPWRSVHGSEYGQRPWPLPNVILMSTIEDQPRADERAPIMAELGGLGWKTGVSIEPMLGPVNVENIQGALWLYDDEFGSGVRMRANGISWVIAGGETGPGARPMHPDWIRSLRDQCKGAGVPFFFKQWGEFGICHENGVPNPVGLNCGFGDRSCTERDKAFDSTMLGMCRVGKRKAGRILDGQEWNEFPEV